jgi:hypothetical protein
MQTTQTAQEAVVDNLYNRAAQLLLHENKLDVEVIDDLVRQGVNHETATAMVNNLQNQIDHAKKERARKDMLYGALWCIGGIIATAADIGFIFWGAILFGGIQFIKGVANAVD